MGLVAFGEAVYVGDNSLWRVLTFKKKDGGYVFAGEAMGYSGPVAALAVDGRGHLLVHSGTPLAPVHLALDKGYTTKGVLWSKALPANNAPVRWDRLLAMTEEIAPHLQFFSISRTRRLLPLLSIRITRALFPRRGVRSSGVTDMIIGGSQARFLWIGVHFIGDGLATPDLSQMRVEFDHETYLRHLPPLTAMTPRREIFAALSHAF
jgi:hypothetical protein